MYSLTNDIDRRDGIRQTFDNNFCWDRFLCCSEVQCFIEGRSSFLRRNGKRWRIRSFNNWRIDRFNRAIYGKNRAPSRILRWVSNPPLIPLWQSFRIWIFFSGSVILFNKWVLDTAGFRTLFAFLVLIVLRFPHLSNDMALNFCHDMYSNPRSNDNPPRWCKNS